MGGVKTIYGIIGYPVAHSLSPIMHNAAFQAAGIDAEYQLFELNPKDPESLENFCYETGIKNIGGFSVTMPYKEEISAFMDYFDPLAKKLGSINTVKNEDGNLIGHNTDAVGALRALQEVTELKGKKALILGAGGAARAIGFILKGGGAEVHVFNRTPENAKEIAKEFDLEIVTHSNIEEEAFDLIVNTTPVGNLTQPEESLLEARQIKKGAVVMDIVTSPIETKLLREAKKAGAKIVSGERMLLHQAAGQFEIWFDKKAPFEVMEKALYQELKKRP